METRKGEAVLVDPMKVVAAMFAAREFAKEAESWLSISAEGLSRTGVDLGFRKKLRMLVERLKDLPTAQE